MDKRKRLGFALLWDKNWMGGMYYAQNLFIALNTLPEEKKPLINVYCKDESDFQILRDETKYPYLEMTRIRKGILRKLIRSVFYFISLRLFSMIDIFKVNPSDDILFPLSSGFHSGKLIYWKPDFQEKYFPDYFTPKIIAKRNRIIKQCCLRKIPILFSSEDSRNDFKKFFPQYIDNPTFVVHFAVDQPDFSGININELKLKYGIKKKYLFCANQFWIHKNHLFLFKSFKKALEKGLDLQLVCTGRMADNRAPEYIKQLRDFVLNNDLENKILTLGMIDKLELLCLMKNSYAVIQPSLFEGWNTTVEDCKAMNKFVFLSDLDVHKEQLNNNVCFFDPRNEEDLINKLLTVTPNEEFIDYSNNIREFGETFLHVMEMVKES